MKVWMCESGMKVCKNMKVWEGERVNVWKYENVNVEVWMYETVKVGQCDSVTV